MKIRNWKLALLALLIFCVFIRLGFWQLTRAGEKRTALKMLTQRMQLPRLHDNKLTFNKKLQYRRIQLNGEYDSEHTFLVDNKILHSRVGYEVFTLFKSQEGQHFLVDRGFIALIDRKKIPQIQQIKGQITLKGLLARPPAYVALGSMIDSKRGEWPLRIEFIDMKQLDDLLNLNLFPLTLILEPGQAGMHEMAWQMSSLPPEKHIGYAVQWFALALTLLILFVALNRKQKYKSQN